VNSVKHPSTYPAAAAADFRALYPHLFASLWGKLALTTYKETMDCASFNPKLSLIITAEGMRGGENYRIDGEHMFALNANQLHS